MFSESKLDTHKYKEIERTYFNASGFKSQAILACSCADSNGSWLRKFNGYAEFYRVTLTSFRKYYWDMGLTTPASASRKWVGKKSPSWEERVNIILRQLQEPSFNTQHIVGA